MWISCRSDCQYLNPTNGSRTHTEYTAHVRGKTNKPNIFLDFSLFSEKFDKTNFLASHFFQQLISHFWKSLNWRFSWRYFDAKINTRRMSPLPARSVVWNQHYRLKCFSAKIWCCMFVCLLSWRHVFLYQCDLRVTLGS